MIANYLPQTAKCSPKKPGELGVCGVAMSTTHHGYLAFPTVCLKGKLMKTIMWLANIHQLLKSKTNEKQDF